MTKKRMMTAAALAGLLAVYAAGSARAATVTPDADSLTITITPNIDYGVNIDTASVHLDLGTLDLYASTQTVSPATVTILGTVYSDGSETTGQELDMSVLMNGGWGIDATPSTDTTSGSVDEVALYALFTDTTLSTPPDGDVFAAMNAGFNAATERAGSGTNNGSKFEKTGGDAVDMDHKSPGEYVHLWMFMRLPPATSGSGQKQITVTATAVPAS